jgi:predicted HTH transcriptional regulator
VRYEIPVEVVSEAIVNAVAHRDYTSNGSVQVMLFADRLEVWNPGTLPPSLTVEMLRQPHGSFPTNPLLAEPLYLAAYIERMGTGTGDMIRRCREAGLPEPEFSVADGFRVLVGRATGSLTGSAIKSTDPVERLLQALRHGELAAAKLRSALGIKHRPTFRANYLRPALDAGLVEYTIPDKPRSRLQKYRLTEKGRAHLAKRGRSR